jgi:RecB family exonuclease
MNAEKLSISGIQAFNKCSWAWYLKYICKQREPSGKAATLGSIVHKVLELLAIAKRNNKLAKYNYPDKLLDIVFRSFQRKNSHLDLGDAELYLCNKWMNIVFASRYDPRELDIIDAEHQFFMELKDKGFHYRVNDYETGQEKTGNLIFNGVIDLIHKIDNDTIEIVDWKSGKRKDWSTGKNKEIDDFRKDLQLASYYLVAREKFPEYKHILVTIYYIVDGGPYTVCLDDSDLKNAYDRLYRNFIKIIQTETPNRLIDDNTRKNEHFFCKKVCHFGVQIDEQEGERLCRKYWNEYRELGFHDFRQKMIQLTIKKT